MKEEHLAYLSQFGVTPDRPLFSKVERLLSLAEVMCPESPEAIFMSEFTRDDGVRELMSFWIFTPSYVLEAKDFAGSGETLDVTNIRKAITWMQIDRKNY